MRGIIFAAILVAMTAAMASPTVAAPVNYDESVSGDLTLVGSPLTTFTLDVGANTISGIFGLDPIVTVDRDSFAFIVPAGTQLLAVQVQLTDAISDIGNGRWSLRSGSANAFTGTFIEELEPLSPGIDTLSSVPLGPGTYNLSHDTFDSIGCGQTDNCKANYTFTLTLRAAAVVEPAIVTFLGAGLVGLGAMLWWLRRKQPFVSRRRPRDD